MQFEKCLSPPAETVAGVPTDAHQQCGDIFSDSILKQLSSLTNWLQPAADILVLL